MTKKIMEKKYNPSFQVVRIFTCLQVLSAWLFTTVHQYFIICYCSLSKATCGRCAHTLESHSVGTRWKDRKWFLSSRPAIEIILVLIPFNWNKKMKVYLRNTRNIYWVNTTYWRTTNIKYKWAYQFCRYLLSNLLWGTNLSFSVC